MPDYQIICPYCFHKFSHDKAVFRANTKISARDAFINSVDDILGTGKKKAPDVDQYFMPFDSADSTSSEKRLDHKLISFWQNRGGPSAYPKGWEYPHIDPSDPTSFRAMTRRNCSVANMVIGEDGLVRDMDGFVKRVVDVKSDPTVAMTRLCPSCHNPMPLQEYGKYPVIFISVVGVTGAGKTVFLNQLLTTFSDAVEHTGFRPAANNLDEIGEAIRPATPLPESTDAKLVRPPLAALLMRKNPRPGEAKGVTVVFYDIAGENCVNSRGEPDAMRAKSTIGNFIAYSDGLIFLIDPEQLPPFATGRQARPSDIAQVVSVMNQIRSDINLDKPQWNDIPVAVTIAKSDKLRNCADIPVDSPLFRYPDEHKEGYHREENLTIDKFLSNLLAARANATVAPLNAFRLRNYFAISAITCGVESRFIKYRNEYILDSENENKFQDLRRWLQDWNVRTPEDRQYYRKCPVRMEDGSPIEFDYSVTITKDMCEHIVTEIRADSVDCPSINLTLWDVFQEINLIGYPMAEPSPRRVEDPLKWIMWQLRLIGPYFARMPVPKKGTFMSKKRYAEIVEEVRMANFRDEKTFYGHSKDEA